MIKHVKINYIIVRFFMSTVLKLTAHYFLGSRHKNHLPYVAKMNSEFQPNHKQYMNRFKGKTEDALIQAIFSNNRIISTRLPETRNIYKSRGTVLKPE